MFGKQTAVDDQQRLEEKITHQMLAMPQALRHLRQSLSEQAGRAFGLILVTIVAIVRTLQDNGRNQP